jgi:predicted alpha/beta-hydrolase family hydrolase
MASGRAARRPLLWQVVEIETSAGPARVDLAAPAGRPAFLLLLTHGSGGTPDTADVLAVRDAGLALGAVTALVTQPYVVRGARAPGSADKQDAAWAQVVATLRAGHPGLPVIQGGRSNGARVVCRTAGSVGASGVIALAFPLHPPGHPERLRVNELPKGTPPTLVLNGERDPFGIPEGGDGIRVVVLPGETHALSKDPAAIGGVVKGWLREILAGSLAG